MYSGSTRRARDQARRIRSAPGGLGRARDRALRAGVLHGRSSHHQPSRRAPLRRRRGGAGAGAIYASIKRAKEEARCSSCCRHTPCERLRRAATCDDCGVPGAAPAQGARSLRGAGPTYLPACPLRPPRAPNPPRGQELAKMLMNVVGAHWQAAVRSSCSRADRAQACHQCKSNGLQLALPYPVSPSSCSSLPHLQPLRTPGSRHQTEPRLQRSRAQAGGGGSRPHTATK
jgi:hypothetical protein